jgi:hypothetical protein
METAIVASTILQFVLMMTWTCLKDTPSLQKNVLYAQFITSQAVLEEIASTTSLTFAPELFAVLQATAPPSIEYFKSLPIDTLQCWAIYLVILEKPGCPPKLYIGSGTDAVGGLSKRFQQYDTLTKLPQYVKKAIEEGYKIVHKAPLCWIPILSASLVPNLRLLFIALEATFSYMLWAMRTVSGDYGMTHICLWDRNTLEYEGLCSHCSLNEGISGDFGLSAEALEALAAEKTVARCVRAVEVHSNYHYKQMETNREGYLEKQREQQAALRTRSPERINNRLRNWRKNTHESKRLFSETCKVAFESPRDQRNHNNTPGHLNKAKRMKLPYTCIPCAYGSKKKTDLEGHCKTERHKKIVAALSSSQLD